jgi:hypothetical protein
MTSFRLFVLGALLATLPGAAARGDDPKVELPSDAQFGRMMTVLLEDPFHDKAQELAKAIVVFTMATPKATVMLGEEELTWIGKKSDDRSLLLFAAFAGGNTHAQLLTGVKQNDRYSGLIALFGVYRRLQEKDKDFKVAEVEALLKLHSEGKLLAHLLKMEEKKPTRLTPEQEAELKKLLKDRK